MSLGLSEYVHLSTYDTVNGRICKSLMSHHNSNHQQHSTILLTLFNCRFKHNKSSHITSKMNINFSYNLFPTNITAARMSAPCQCRNDDGKYHHRYFDIHFHVPYLTLENFEYWRHGIKVAIRTLELIRKAGGDAATEQLRLYVIITSTIKGLAGYLWRKSINIYQSDPWTLFASIEKVLK